MPYIKETLKGIDGDIEVGEKYVPSIYAKEELPTWSEIWEEFWLNEAFDYEPDDPDQNREGKLPNSKPSTLIQYMDMYWKLPHRKMLLGWMCNQLNKILFEDGFHDTIIDFINSKVYQDTIAESVRFMLIGSSNDGDKTLSLEKVAPPIITCELPSTNERSIFASKHPAINIKSFTGPINLAAFIVLSKGKNKGEFMIVDKEFKEFKEIIHEMLRITGVVSYYSGEGPGWKDENGNLIESDIQPRRGCDGAGVDPAI